MRFDGGRKVVPLGGIVESNLDIVPDSRAKYLQIKSPSSHRKAPVSLA